MKVLKAFLGTILKTRWNASLPCALIVMMIAVRVMAVGPTNTPPAATRAVMTDTNNNLTGPSTNLFLANSNLLAAAIGSISTNGFATALALAGTNTALVLQIKTLGTNLTNFVMGWSQPVNGVLTYIGGLGTNWLVYTNDTRLTNARTALSHTHTESDVINLVGDLAGKLVASLNLSDLANAATARNNLGVLSSNATVTLITNTVNALTNGVIVLSTDPRMTNARPPTAHGHAETDVTNLVADLAAKVTKSGNGLDFASIGQTRTNLGAVGATNPVFYGMITGGLSQYKTNFPAPTNGWYRLAGNNGEDFFSGLCEVSYDLGEGPSSLSHDILFSYDGVPFVSSGMLEQIYYIDGGGFELKRFAQIRLTMAPGDDNIALDLLVTNAPVTNVIVSFFGNIIPQNTGILNGNASLGLDIFMTPSMTNGVSSFGKSFGGPVTAGEPGATNQLVTLYGLTHQAASNITSGTIASARIDPTLALTNGVVMTNISGGAIQTGTVAGARIDPTVGLTNGANLTNFNAANLTGSIADARLSGNVATLANAQTFSAVKGLTNQGNTISGNGAGLTNLQGSIVTNGSGATVTATTNVATGRVTYTVGASGGSVGTNGAFYNATVTNSLSVGAGALIQSNGNANFNGAVSAVTMSAESFNAEDNGNILVFAGTAYLYDEGDFTVFDSTDLPEGKLGFMTPVWSINGLDGTTAGLTVPFTNVVFGTAMVPTNGLNEAVGEVQLGSLATSTNIVFTHNFPSGFTNYAVSFCPEGSTVVAGVPASWFESGRLSNGVTLNVTAGITGATKWLYVCKPYN